MAQLTTPTAAGAAAATSPPPRPPRRRRGRLVWAVLGGLLAAAALASLPALLRAARMGSSARSQLLAAESDLRAGRRAEAQVLLRAGAYSAAKARERLSGPAVAIVSRIPLLGRPVRSARMLAEATAQAAIVADSTLDLFPDRSAVSGGRVDLARLAPMQAAAVRAERGLRAAAAEARRAPAWPLPPALGRARRQLVGKLDAEVSTVTATNRILSFLPAALGAKGPRRYLLVVQNPDELRGTGGFWGNYGLVDANRGRVTLAEFGRPYEDLGRFAANRGPDWYERRYSGFQASDDWRQFNMTPDFPTAAALGETDLASATGIGPVDGVIAVDPVGLAALLKITGPVSVPGWPSPIDASNVVPVTLHDAYARFQSDQRLRITFLADVARAVWSRLLTTEIPLRSDTLGGLGQAVRQRRVMFHFARPDEQGAVARLGADGALAGSPARTFGLVTQNTAGHKMDYWLRRRLSLDVRLRRDGSAEVTATVVLHNGGAAQGEPAYMVGPVETQVAAGWNRQLVSLYVPGAASERQGAETDLPLDANRELGYAVGSSFVDLPPLGDRRLQVHLDVPHLWDPVRGLATLEIRRQPALLPDDVDIRVTPAPGWGTTGGGQVKVRDGVALWRGATDRDVSVTVRMGRTWA